MSEDSGSAGYIEARRMLDICASVGARAVDVTWTDSAGDPRRFRRNKSLADLARTMPRILESAGRQRHNVIIRPHGPGLTFLQLDDLDGDQLARVAAVAFIVIETSPTNYQAWLAIEGRLHKHYSRRVRRGTGADTGASGATRIPGSTNWKEKYAPNFPRVTIRHTQPGRRTSADELEQLGLVAPEQEFPPLCPPRSRRNTRWPSYEKTLDGAPLNREGTGPDRSRCDYVWCMTAISWGFSVEDTAAELMQHSEKARAVPGYALLTVTKAAEAVDRRRPQRLTTEHTPR